VDTDAGRWRRCSSCKTAIGFGAPYWVCNVSTCNRGRTALAFCSVSCWDAHLAVVNHRESWALERRAPSRAEWEREQQAVARAADAPGPAPAGAGRPAAPRRILPPPSSSPRRGDSVPRDVLVVVSKLKSYVRARSGMNTSDRVVDPLSDALRELCDRAIERARAEGRRTVLDRDFEEE
jgi:hypothetical protein